MSTTTKAIIIAALIAYVEARFGQEQIPVAAVQALTNRGSPGVSATLAGSVPGVLLAGANACAKLELADKIVTELGTTQDVIDAAKGVVKAEQNFNPFAAKTNKICDDPKLPVTAELRGIVPLVDPTTDADGKQNANAAASLQKPFNAAGLSVAQVTEDQGFTNFTLGETGALAAAGDKSKAAADAPATASDSMMKNNVTALKAAAVPAGVDFGKCKPTMDFVAGRPGRKATESTFLPTDPLVAKGQQDALNPNIITNRICDQLTNVCAANAAAKTLCQESKAKIQALGTKDQSTANAWNAALGF